MPTMDTLEEIRGWRWRHQSTYNFLKKQESQREHGKYSLSLKKATTKLQNGKRREIQLDKYKTSSHVSIHQRQIHKTNKKPGGKSVSIYDTRDKPSWFCQGSCKLLIRWASQIHGCPLWKRLVSREMSTHEHQDNNSLFRHQQNTHITPFQGSGKEEESKFKTQTTGRRVLRSSGNGELLNHEVPYRPQQDVDPLPTFNHR